jgi:hypothetical protein
MEALGHSSAAVNRFYAKGARVEVPSLEDYELPNPPVPPPPNIIPLPQRHEGHTATSPISAAISTTSQ